MAEQSEKNAPPTLKDISTVEQSMENAPTTSKYMSMVEQSDDNASIPPKKMPMAEKDEDSALTAPKTITEVEQSESKAPLTSNEMATAEKCDSNAPTMPKKIILRAAEGTLFEVEEAIAMEFGAVKNYLEESSAGIIPLPNVESHVLAKVIDYARKHIEFQSDFECESKGDIKAFDEEYVKDVDNEEIKELILSANYLDYKELLDFLNQNVVDRIKNKSVEYVRRFFGIKNDFTPEEERKLREENAWAFEGVDED